MRLILFILLTLGLLPIYSQSQSELFFKLGQQQLIKGYPNAALSDLTKAINLSPDFIEAYAERAKAYLIMANAPAALEDINKVIESKHSDPELLLLRSKIFNAMKRHKEALFDINSALEIKKDFPEALSEKLFTFYYMGEETKTMNIINEEIKKKPQAYLFFTRAIIYSIQEKYSKAEKDFNQAQKLDSKLFQYEIYINRGIAYIELKKIKKAEIDIKKAFDLKPGYYQGFLSRGKLLYKQERYKESITEFETVLADIPGQPDALYNIGMSYLKLSDSVKACTNFQNSCNAGNETACKMLVVECAKK